MKPDPKLGGRRRYALAASAVFAIGACDDPTQNTDLRPEGPPEVLSVLVMNDAVSGLIETATFCKLDDDKRPSLVGLPDFTTQQVCDENVGTPADMVTNAYPDGWYVRIMFDELLDPDIEELTEIIDPDTGQGTDTYQGSIANTRPVTLECESVSGGFVAVDYDGYYSPAGNNIIWPLGPALVIKPDHPELVATTKMCRVTINDNVVDKSGEPVPAAQRGPFEFKIAPITPIFIDPEDGAEVDALALWYDNAYIQFNTNSIVDSSIACDDGVGNDECEFAFSPDNKGVCSTGGEYCTIGGAACPTGGDTCDPVPPYSYTYAPQGAASEFGFGPSVPLETEKEYTFELLQGAKVVDHCGVETTFGAPSVAGNSKITFTTSKFGFSTTSPGDGDSSVSALKKFSLQFNNVLDPSTLDAAEYSLTPAPESPSIGTSLFNDGDFLFLGHYKPETMYTFTLKNNATIADAYGVVYTQTGDRTISWTTQAIGITSTTPADGGTSTKASAGDTTVVSIKFNQSMNVGSLLSTEYSFTDANGVAVPNTLSTTGCGPTSTSCAINFESNLPLAPGAYKLTLNAGATITDLLTTPTTYTQSADRVINFTVTNAAPTTPVVCL